ncbi:hypothetical protein HY967_01775, partial [Candidatus Jorgensenbacteria bacterium]|nr:hypothetical protein [Candidatus Jorgensenbacteria bacterium]
QNCRYCLWLLVKPVKDCWDYTEFGDGAERVYECATVGNGATNVSFSIYAGKASFNMEYAAYCFGVSHVFGCVGLRKKEHCILNKQYTPQAFEGLRQKIINGMHETPYIDTKGRVYTYGEFFPVELSPFAYNETSAQQFFPLDKTQADQFGFRWTESEEKNYNIDVFPDELPDATSDTTEEITNKIIGCEHKGTCKEQCATAFKITPSEVIFYKKCGLPLPRLCPNCRHYERLQERTPLIFIKRVCACNGEKSKNGVYTNSSVHFHGASNCPNEFETSYATDRLEIVYCEQCYQAEVA